MKKIISVFCLLASFCAMGQQSYFQQGKRNLTSLWELDRDSRRGTFRITPYRPIYIAPLRWTNSPNRLPHNTNPDNGTPRFRDWSHFEAEFQISLKTKIIESAIFGKGDLWLGFTQLAIWQVYTPSESRPFRELNYEPEIMFNMPLNFSIKNLNIRMAGISFNHQSNGREASLSRSWNRIIIYAGLDYKNFTLLLRNWYRLPESKEYDDNYNITHYIGKGDATAIYTRNGQVFSLVLSSTLSLKAPRGSLSFTWAYPIKGNLKLLFQASHGYGSSLIDFNHKQTYLGLGFSLQEWL